MSSIYFMLRSVHSWPTDYMTSCVMPSGLELLDDVYIFNSEYIDYMELHL